MEIPFEYAMPISSGYENAMFENKIGHQCRRLAFTWNYNRTRLMLGKCFKKYGESLCDYPQNDIQYYAV